MTTKDLECVKANSVNPLYLIFNKVNGYFEENKKEIFNTNESKEKSLSKVLERIMCNRVYNYLDSKCLRYKKQIVFQRNNST